MDDKVQLTGVNNFKEMICDFSTFKSENLKYSRTALKESILPPAFTDEIGGASIDFYAFELTYFYINNLNYQPRPTLQSGCLYIPPGIDKINARHMNSENAPEYMIWTGTADNGLRGIDGRYLLNSDGDYLNAFLGNYTRILEDSKRSLWKRTGNDRLEEKVLLKKGYRQCRHLPEA